MPVLQISRQPDRLAWFGSTKGRPLLLAEQAAVSHAFAARPSGQPWLWIAPQEAVEAADPPSRTLRLHPWGGRFQGDLQCGLPLPLPSESVGNIVLQHVLDDGREGLLDECVRVLEPGGRLWLFVLNPTSPYRARWRSSGLVGWEPHAWRQRLRGLGLLPCGGEVAYLGPVWRMAPTATGRVPGRLRAACLLEVEKRTGALVPPAPAKRQWRTGAAPA